MTDNERPPRARRARFEDVVRLERRIESLETRNVELLNMLERSATSDPGLPMSREYFYALCIISTIVSGGWNHLKYADQRAAEAYRVWQQICRPKADVDVSVAPV